jgi:hypothetical protein
MRKGAVLVVAMAGLVGALAGRCFAEDARTLHGSYALADGDGKGDLRAVFTATGERRWDVAFHFSMQGKPHVYAGTAEGSLSEGALKGTVKDEGKDRTFTFRGTFEGGKFQGTHAEITGGREQPTGTLTLRG